MRLLRLDASCEINYNEWVLRMLVCHDGLASSDSEVSFSLGRSSQSNGLALPCQGTTILVELTENVPTRACSNAR